MSEDFVPIVAFDMEVDLVFPSHSDNLVVLKALNAAWNWFPKTLEDEAPEGCVEAHHAVHGTHRVTVRVEVDRYGNKRIAK